MPTCFAISRTCDYHHHWQDVTVGSLLGMFLSLLVYHIYYPLITDENCDIPKSDLDQLIGQKDETTILTEVETSI